MSFTKEEIIAQLPIQERWNYTEEDVEKFAGYCVKLSKDEKSKFINSKSAKDLASLFRRVQSEGIPFDGVHVTLQSTGISYDYVAYKNKMYLAYPETKFDVGIVFKGDSFNFEKTDWSVVYQHTISNPFGQKDIDIIGAYAVVRNSRGEFLTTLSAEDIAKHRKVAKTDFIWKAWFQEMCLKTITKKACKLHYGDVYRKIEEMDNEQYDLSRVSVDKIKESAQSESTGSISSLLA